MLADDAFVCVCCKETHPCGEASIDSILNGRVCQCCKTNLNWSGAWLKKAGITRVVAQGDVNAHNYKRFVIP